MKVINFVIALALLVVVSACNSASTTPANCKDGNGQVVTTQSGLKYEDLVVCDGKPAKDGDMVSVHYVGTLENGSQFDSSFTRNQPFPFTLGGGQVIKGWDEGVKGMTVGSKRRLVIPAALGYGPQGSPPTIPGNATLIFVVQVMDIK